MLSDEFLETLDRIPGESEVMQGRIGRDEEVRGDDDLYQERILRIVESLPDHLLDLEEMGSHLFLEVQRRNLGDDLGVENETGENRQ